MTTPQLPAGLQGPQPGRTFLVTGATSGIGQAAAVALALAGARVVLAGRSETRLAATRKLIERLEPAARLESLLVDMASLASVRAAADSARALGPIDVLINNAGMYGASDTTADGLDRLQQTNHFGPFLFTGLLLPQLLQGQRPRVVAVTSVSHHLPRQPLGTGPLPVREQEVVTYGRTKLANLLTTYELQRRSDLLGLGLRAMAAHPGFARTGIVQVGQVLPEGTLRARVGAAIGPLLAQSAEQGAACTLLAATADLPGGTHVGPRAIVRGAPVVQKTSRLSRDPEAAARLWEYSEGVVGHSWPVPLS